MIPDDRKYTQSHEWARQDGELVVIGITDHAQKEMGDITFVELPEAGRKVEAGESCGVIESVKAASDLYAPLGGEVVEINAGLEDEPQLVNEDAHGAGWMIKLKPDNADGLAGLLSAADYEARL